MSRTQQMNMVPVTAQLLKLHIVTLGKSPRSIHKDFHHIVRQ